MRKNNIAIAIYIDLVFNLAAAFIVLFMLVIMLINPIAKQNDIDTVDNLMITLDWNNDSGYDMDLHFKQPDGRVIFFNDRESLLASLERDDLGKTNDVDGFVVNREVLHIRHLVDGNYVVNVHFYSTPAGEALPQNIEIEFVKIQPDYRIYVKKKLTIPLVVKEEVTMFSFSVVNGEVVVPIDTSTQYKVVR